MPKILARIKKQGCVLMLDFDGVLSSIVRTPHRASFSSRTRRLLARCAAHMPVAIITGRPLADIMRRVGLQGLVYAGSHGFEWKINGHAERRRVSAHAAADFRAARRTLLACAAGFRGTLAEEKRHCLAVHYRGLSRAGELRFRRAAHAAMAPFAGAIRVIDNLCTFEIMPSAEWTKGDCARLIWRGFCNGAVPVPIYIGDSLTDEDAFLALKKGITIRVGRNIESAARYFFKTRAEVNAFLAALTRGLYATR